MHSLYFLLAASYAEAAARSFREGRRAEAIHQALTAAVYFAMAVLSLLPIAAPVASISSSG